MKKKPPRRLLFNIVIVLFVPALLVVAELVLRLAGVGYDTRPFVQSANLPESYFDNPSYYWKYYPDFQGRVGIEARNAFAAHKAANALRGFVIGESTAEGYPFNSNQSFSKILQNALQQGFPDKKVEIVNQGLSAMTSYYTRDQAMKVLDYQPDFIVLYGGHNEIYGTVSQSTGATYAGGNLYLALKEFRLFQVLYDALNHKGAAPGADRTLMAEQFKDKRYDPDPKVDDQVAANFVRNMEALVAAYDKRRIPVIVVEPVSNLIDMPPFAGKDDAADAGPIAAYRKVLAGGDAAAAAAFHAERLKHPEYNANANMLYLDALYARRYEGKTDLDLFANAKDHDAIPFRARSATVLALRDFAGRGKGRYPALNYIPTAALIQQAYGAEGFGKRLFIDQLHFNFDGQVFLAKSIADEGARLFGMGEAGKSAMAAYLADAARVKADLSLLPYYEVGVYSSISYLTADEPFKSMKIPYETGTMDDYFPHNPFYEDKALWERCVSSYGSPEFFNSVLQGLAAKGDYEGILQYRLAAVRLHPANAADHLNLAKAYSAFDDRLADALAETTLAYRLSGRSQLYYKELQGFLEFSKQSDQLAKIVAAYGEPQKN